VSSIAPAQTTYEGTCPVGRGGSGCALVVRSRPGGWTVHCRSATCEADSSEWLREVAAIVGAPGGYAVLQDPLKWLSDYLEAETRTDREPEQLPSLASIHGRASRLFSDAAIDWLMDERKLTSDTIGEYGLGWESEPPAFTFPIYAAGELVNVVRRPLPHISGPKYVAMRGRDQHNGGVQIYPNVPRKGPILLVEGLLDALLGRQEGLPAITSTHGVNTFLEEWLPLMRGRRVAVMYDVGAEKVMHNRVAQLRAAGSDAWGVRLRLLLRGDGKDLSDHFMCGGTAQELKDLINDEHRMAS
jgi:hypothetical protein